MAHFRQRRASELAIDFEKSPSVVVYVGLRRIFLQAAQSAVAHKLRNRLVHSTSAEDLAPIVDANQRVVGGELDAIDDIHVRDRVDVPAINEQKIKFHVVRVPQAGNNV